MPEYDFLERFAATFNLPVLAMEIVFFILALLVLLILIYIPLIARQIRNEVAGVNRKMEYLVRFIKWEMQQRAPQKEDQEESKKWNL
jgi:predicted PurR-regulated permease PerM